MNDAEQEIQRIIDRSVQVQLALLAVLEMALAGDPQRVQIAMHAAGELTGRLMITRAQEHPPSVVVSLSMLEDMKQRVTEAAGTAIAPALTKH